MSKGGDGTQRGNSDNKLGARLVPGDRNRNARLDQQRLHAHQRKAPLRGELIQHPPPVASRLARHRHRREPRRTALARAQSSNSPSSHSRVIARERELGEHPRVEAEVRDLINLRKVVGAPLSGGPAGSRQVAAADVLLAVNPAMSIRAGSIDDLRQPKVAPRASSGRSPE